MQHYHLEASAKRAPIDRSDGRHGELRDLPQHVVQMRLYRSIAKFPGIGPGHERLACPGYDNSLGIAGGGRAYRRKQGGTYRSLQEVERRIVDGQKRNTISPLDPHQLPIAHAQTPAKRETNFVLR